MKLKYIALSAFAMLFFVGLYVAFTPTEAHAQFIPCVWPNKC